MQIVLLESRPVRPHPLPKLLCRSLVDRLPDRNAKMAVSLQEMVNRAGSKQKKDMASSLSSQARAPSKNLKREVLGKSPNGLDCRFELAVLMKKARELGDRCSCL